MGFIYRNSFPCAIRSQGLGALCRMGSHGEETCHRRTRRACKPFFLVVSIEPTPYLILIPALPFAAPWCLILPILLPKTLTFFLVPQVRLWEPKTGKPIGEPLKGHSKWVTSLAWEPIHLCVRLSLFASSCFRSPYTFNVQSLIPTFQPSTLRHLIVDPFVPRPFTSSSPGNRDSRFLVFDLGYK